MLPIFNHYYVPIPIFRHVIISDKVAKELIEEAMKSGSTPQRNMVGVITGLMGAGKTTLLCNLFGEPPPSLYTSTRVAKKPFRGLVQLVRLSPGKLQHITHKSIQEYLAPLIKGSLNKEKEDHMYIQYDLPM